MKIKLHVTGIFCNGVAIEDSVLNFECECVTAKVVLEATVQVLQKMHALFDEDGLILAVDGKVVVRSDLNDVIISNEQVFSVFPPLFGG